LDKNTKERSNGEIMLSVVLGPFLRSSVFAIRFYSPSLKDDLDDDESDEDIESGDIDSGGAEARASSDGPLPLICSRRRW
jgi:hypothetical protein